MSDLAAARGRAPTGWSYVAVALAIAAAVMWVLAGIVDDGLYVFAGVLGIAGFACGLKGRRNAIRSGARRWPAVAAIVVGGFLGGAVVVAFVGWSVYHLVS